MENEKVQIQQVKTKTNKAMPASHLNNLGFGTSRLLGSALTDKGRLNLLDQVYDLGVTHFDTAPLYGWGKAESLLGQFVQNKRSSVTLVTKYGLSPNILPLHLRLAAPLGRLLTNNSATIKKYIATLIEKKYTGPAHHKKDVSSSNDQGSNKMVYTKPDIESNLHKSLKNFQTDYIDIYLLHECAPEHISEELITWLEDFKQAGKIKIYGLATNRDNALKILQDFPTFKGTIQIHHSITGLNDGLMNCSNNEQTITHSIFKDSVDLVKNQIFKDEASIKKYSTLADFDLDQPDALQTLIFSIAAYQNVHGIKLFSSQQLAHIKANVELFIKPSISEISNENIVTELLRQSETTL